ncbi:transcriptional regulator [Pseudorhizobium endolithicum]|uniref:Transcriptional regulator n=1 Tax=Pseudorhizobium endolithicum TaxID=1191678 RepID=A0ABN7JYU6_9HYPH|nr:helix-turn-helix transcriptional regulator [Pseudorhizobium endolithicum]CAD6424765.1 transcriptional regulator [Rhizobium sp. Q54]CAD7054620.1 transcriptional regulator [Pseudorhizobium endolithicum]
MSVSMNNFEGAVKTAISPQRVSAALIEVRQSMNYSLDQVAVTTGLTVGELTAIENGDAADPAQLQRIASALGLPPATFLLA